MLLGLVFLGISTYIGWQKYALHTKRVRVLGDFLSFLRFSVGEIENFKTKFEQVVEKYQFNTKELCAALKNKSTDSLAVLLNAREDQEYNDVLTSFFVLNYGEVIVRVKLAETKFTEFLDTERNIGAKNAKLGLKLGVLIGILSFVLVI